MTAAVGRSGAEAGSEGGLDRMPPGLAGAATLFWGTQVGLLGLAVGMAVLVEAAWLWKARWRFSRTDVHRIWELTLVLLLGDLTLAFVFEDGLSAVSGVVGADTGGARLEAWRKATGFVLRAVQWLPPVGLPLLLVSVWGEGGRVELRAISAWAAGQWDTLYGRDGDEVSVPVRWIYVGTCVLAAGAAPGVPWVLFAGLVVLVAWALWPLRSRSHGMATWALSFFGAAVLGLLGVVAWAKAQGVLEDWNNRLMASWSGRQLEDGLVRSQTAIGTVGRMHLSGAVLMRLRAEQGPVPGLLRETAFDAYDDGVWRAMAGKLSAADGDAELGTWVLGTGVAPGEVTIERSFRGRQANLAVPLGVQRVENLPAESCRTNRYGAIRVEGAAGWAAYRARFGDVSTMDALPGDEDLVVPDEERAVLEAVLGELGLAGGVVDAAGVRRLLSAFFQERFTYRTSRGVEHEAGGGRTALGRFLAEHRSGHCEYFATATVLLLRAAGIPARYAVGFSVQERKGDTYWIRRRHGHAWALAWDAGRGTWESVDNTPADWLSVEEGFRSSWEGLRDFWSSLWNGFARWRAEEAGMLRSLLPWISLALLAVVMLRLFWNRGWRRAGGEAPAAPSEPVPGADSEFYEVLRGMEAAGWGLLPGEPLRLWWRRVRDRIPDTSNAGRLEELLELHERLRFRPGGIGPDEREKLRAGVRALTSRPVSSCRGANRSVLRWR